MSRLLLFIYLHDDESNPIEGLMNYIESQDKRIHFVHDGVVRLAENTFLFEETTTHGLLTLLCAEAQKRGRAYLLVPVDGASSLLAGMPAKDIQDILAKFEVPSCPPLFKSS
jgi:hypothetical protein